MMHQQQTALENIVGKEEIAHNEQFLLFPQCFQLNQAIVSLFVHVFDFISSLAVELEEPRIGISGKGLKTSIGMAILGKGKNLISFLEALNNRPNIFYSNKLQAFADQKFLAQMIIFVFDRVKILQEKVKFIGLLGKVLIYSLELLQLRATVHTSMIRK